MSAEIEINSHHFTLHPSGALYWKEQKMLLIADVHLGKVSHFRKHGAAVPAQAVYHNLEELTGIVDEIDPITICFLGDLFHSNLNGEWQDFVKWVEYTHREIILVEGNHDIIPRYYYEEIGVTVTEEIVVDGFLLTHHPQEVEGKFNFSGHVHPGVLVRGVGRQSIRLSCFFKNQTGMILPAYGTFTGKHILKPTAMDEVYALADGEVIRTSQKLK